jgi:hypothetical protein
MGRRRLATSRPDVIAIGLLIGIPVVVLSAAALAGYPLITGDDLAQNYPLSVLSGEIIAHGHLPIYNPYLWSGAPLLGAANAHALLPTTLLFTFLPNLVAWVLAEALTLGIAAVGAFTMLRRNGCRTLAAALGGATFGLGGFVSSQIVHVDFVAAAAALTWCLVALDGIVRDEPRRRALWALVLAVASACVGLSGSPDIVIDTLVSVVVYGTHLLIGARNRLRPSIAWAAVGGGTGILLSAVQWVPTANFVAVYERAHAGFAFAASGSVAPAALLLLVLPHMLGGGPIGLKDYVGGYNLAELDAYCGILSLVAAAALATRWRSAHATRWRVWYLVGGLGLLLAVGAHTPLEHFVVHLPIVGDQRLPSRALVLFSLASAMLLGHWIEDQLAAKPGGTRPAYVLGGLLAPAVVLGLIAATFISRKPFGGLLDASAGSSWSLQAVAPYLVTAAATALAAGAIVIAGRSWPRRRLAYAIAILAVADLLLFTADQSSLAPTYAWALSTRNPLQAQLAARLSGGGRFLVVDPARTDGLALDQIGASDLGVMSGVASAQGYGSLTWGPYASATGTHSQDELDPAALASGVFDSLDVRVLLTLPNELSVPLKRDQTRGAPPGQPPGIGAPPIAGTGAVQSPIDLRAGQRATRWFGRALVVRTVTLDLSGSAPSTPGLSALGRAVRLLPSAGAASSGERPSVVVTGAKEVTVSFGRAGTSIGVVTTDPLGRAVKLDSVRVTTRSGISYRLDGALAAGLTGPHWVPSGTIGPFIAFTNLRAAGPLSLAPGSGKAGTQLRFRVLQSSPWTPTETVSFTSTAPTKVLRSVAAIPGWSATEVLGGQARPVRLLRSGLVQSFAIPAGTTVVTFTYDPPGLRLGLYASGVGLAALLALGFALAVRSSSGRPLIKQVAGGGDPEDEPDQGDAGDAGEPTLLPSGLGGAQPAEVAQASATTTTKSTTGSLTSE